MTARRYLDVIPGYSLDQGGTTPVIRAYAISCPMCSFTRPYISRVENGHVVPSIETLEKFARALEVPMYQLLYDGEEPSKLLNLLKRKSSDNIASGSSGKDARFLNKLRRLLRKADEEHRKLVMAMTQKLARR